MSDEIGRVQGCLRDSASDVDSRVKTGPAADQTPKFVREAQSEMDRLITSLAIEGEAHESEHRASECILPETSNRRPSDASSVQLIISTKQALTSKYGKSGFERLDSALRDLKRAIESHAGAEAVVAYVDDETSLARFGLQPGDPTDPWQVKRLVDSIDAHLAERRQGIRHLLIVGGDGIVPFHRLPNPVDDQDPDVPSDNPYASRDTSYLVPERAIGRMPDGQNEDVGFLHRLIQTSVEAHQQRATSKGLLSALGAALDRMRWSRGDEKGLGYSASIWRRASRAVFHVIGHDGQLRTCPPLTYEGFRVVEPPRLSYFNLHGIEDGPNWYGQRDALFPADYPLFPLALRPQDPSINEHRNAVVFTEACYGANTLGKDASDSIALRLMAAGALGVVGSTKISYGSIAPPLLGADLMGRHFWEGLRDHLTVGEALRHAKAGLASEMQDRQGYLDDEDQKALISFVLYGDPSLPVTSVRAPAVMGVPTDIFCPSIICSKKPKSQKGTASDELVASVKARIETSLPHMSRAEVRTRPLTMCGGMCKKDCNRLSHGRGHALRSSGELNGLHRKRRGWALTLRKDIVVGGEGPHRQVVKVVVDEKGHILRMAVSK